jgi:type IV pilus assembly protein PilZ
VETATQKALICIDQDEKSMSNPTAPGPRNGILSLTIKDKSVLYAAYMPFVKHGGLFIPTNKSYRLSDEVFMLLNLMDEPEKIPVAGKVIWITPKGAQGNRAAGIGVQFSDQDNTARSKIETYLAGALKSDRPTHTM